MPRTKVSPISLPAKFSPRFYEDADQRSHVVREIKRRIETLTNDCGADTIQKQILVARAIFLSTLIETNELNALDTGKIDVGQLVQATNSLLGVLKSLGLEKNTKTAIDLKTYVQKKA